MKEMLRLEARAKINLHLDIGAKRADGYHDLISLFLGISLGDTLLFSLRAFTRNCRVTGNFNFPQEENLVYKAVELLRQETGFSEGIHIHVDKVMPQGAGLGGGSADGAAALKGVNQLLGLGLEEEKLMNLGARLGSDVPFFINPLAAVVTGRGEKVCPLVPREDFVILLVCPELRIKTPEAFRWLDESRKAVSPILTPEKVGRFFEEEKIGNWPFINSFTPLLLSRFPVYKSIFRDFKSLGAEYWNISGSGAAAFGIFSSSREAGKAKNFFEKQYSFVEIVKPLGTA